MTDLLKPLGPSGPSIRRAGSDHLPRPPSPFPSTVPPWSADPTCLKVSSCPAPRLLLHFPTLLLCCLSSYLVSHC